MPRKSLSIAQPDEPQNPLQASNADKFRSMQSRCMETFSKQLVAVQENVQTARFRWAGEWFNYWYYRLWTIDPNGTNVRGGSVGFESLDTAIEFYGLSRRTFYNYRNEAQQILLAVHGGTLPEGVVFTAEHAKWAYQASREARIIDHRGDLRLLEAPPADPTGEAPELPDAIRTNLRTYYMDKKQAREEAKAQKVKKERIETKIKRNTAAHGLQLLNQAMMGMRILWQNRDAMTAKQRSEYDYLLKMIDLFAGAEAYDAKKPEDSKLEDFTYAQAVEYATKHDASLLREHNRFAHAAIVPGGK